MNRIEAIAIAHGFDLYLTLSFLRIDLVDQRYIAIENPGDGSITFGVWQDIGEETILCFEYRFIPYRTEWVLLSYTTPQTLTITALPDGEIVNFREYHRALDILNAFFDDLMRIAA